MISNRTKGTEKQNCAFFAQNNAIKTIVRLFTKINLIVKIIIEINYVIFDWGVKG